MNSVTGYNKDWEGVIKEDFICWGKIAPFSSLYTLGPTASPERVIQPRVLVASPLFTRLAVAATEERV